MNKKKIGVAGAAVLSAMVVGGGAIYGNIQAESTTSPSPTATIAATSGGYNGSSIAPVETATVMPSIAPTSIFAPTPTIAPTPIVAPTQVPTPTPVLIQKPKKMEVLKAKRLNKRTIQVKWKIQDFVYGYEVQLSTGKKFAKKATKTKDITKYETKTRFKLLKRNKTYYVRLRAYRLDTEMKKVYGKYSKVVKVKKK